MKIEIELPIDYINLLSSYRLSYFMRTNIWLSNYSDIINFILNDYFNKSEDL